MKKILAGLGAALFIIMSALLSTGAPIPLLTNTSGCNEASQLLFCLNTLINTLNGGGQTGMVSLFTGGTGSSVNERDGVTPNPNPGGGTANSTLGPGLGVCKLGATTECASGQTATTLNAQRGLVTFITNVGGANAASGTSTAQGNSSTLMVLNSFITAASSCQATINSIAASTDGSGNSATPGVVFVANVTPVVSIWSGTTSQGALLISLGNSSGVAVPTQTFTIGFWCQ